MARQLDPKTYEYAQAVFGADVVNDVGKVSTLIAQKAGDAAKQLGFKASEWLRQQAERIRAEKAVIVFDDLAGGEAPAGPSREEEIAAARQAVADAEKFVEMCRKFGTGVEAAEAKLAETRKQLAELTGDEEEEEAEVPLPALPAQSVINATAAGYVDLDEHTRALLASLPWERESSKDGKPRRSICCRVETGYTPGATTFLRVWGATSHDHVDQTLQSGKLGLRFIQDKDPETGKPYVIWVFHPEFRPGGTANPNVRAKVRLHEDGKLYAHGQSAMAVTLVGVQQPVQATGVSLIGAKGPR